MKRFTLIELLVVVVIVAILAALLLPALDNAKQRAKVVACGSHQRQLYICISNYAADHDLDTPGASRQVTQDAFGSGTLTLGFGLLTWNGYCETREILACPAANYHKYAHLQAATAATVAEGYGWENFRRPSVLPMRGVQRFLYGDWDGNSIYKSYGSTTSYCYRRGDTQWGVYANVSGAYLSLERVPISQLPDAFVACAQQWRSDGGHGGLIDNYTHGRRGSNVTYREGHVKWLSMRKHHDGFSAAPNPPQAAGCPEYFLPYTYHFDYEYAWPAMRFWSAATNN